MNLRTLFRGFSEFRWWLTLLGAIVLAGCAEDTPQSADGTTAANSSSQAGGEKRIIILTNGDSPYWNACRAGMKDAASELKLAKAGFTAVLEVNDGTPDRQLVQLRQFASQSDIAAVGISAVDANNVAIAEAMRKLQSQGVKVVTIDSDVDRDSLRDARFAFIGTDNRSAGRVLGECAAELRTDGGNYVTFVGRTGAQNAIERIEGFAEGAGQGFKQLDSMADDTDFSRARENVRNALLNHADLNMLVGIWSYNAPAIVDVVKESNKRAETTIVVFDAEPTAIKHMNDGFIDAMLVQNPHQMGYQGVRLLKALVEDDQSTISEMLPNYGQADGDLYDTGLKVVAPNEKSVLQADMFDENVEFLTLKNFQSWLKKYNLIGS